MNYGDITYDYLCYRVPYKSASLLYYVWMPIIMEHTPCANQFMDLYQKDETCIKYSGLGMYRLC